MHAFVCCSQSGAQNKDFSQTHFNDLFNLYLINITIEVFLITFYINFIRFITILTQLITNSLDFFTLLH